MRVIIIDTVSTYVPPKKLSEIPNPKNSMWSVGKILKWWGEKAKAGVAIYIAIYTEPL